MNEALEEFKLELGKSIEDYKRMIELQEQFIQTAGLQLAFQEFLKSRNGLDTNVKTEELSLQERYTEAMKMAGYEQVPVLDDSMETVKFRNQETDVEIFSDGWGGIGSALEGMSISDDMDVKRFEELIHPQNRISFYTVDPIEMNMHHDYQSALEAYLNTRKNGAEMGFHMDGQFVPMVKLSNIDNRQTVLFSREVDVYQRFSELAAENEMKFLDEIKVSFNRVMDKEYAYETVENALEDLTSQLIGDIEQDALPRPWAGRVVNDQRPQDYIELEIACVRLDEVDITIRTVQANAVRGTYVYSIDGKDLLSNKDMGILAWNERLGGYLKSEMDRLNTDYEYRFTFFSLFTEHSLEEHYELLHNAGYEHIPDESFLGEPVNNSCTADVQEYSRQNDDEKHQQNNQKEKKTMSL